MNTMNKRFDIVLAVLIVTLILVVFSANMLTGDAALQFDQVFRILCGEQAENPAWPYIVENRLNRSITAVLAGGALALSGIVLQVFFRNPLAGPGVLGVTSGASLGVAIVILGGLSAVGWIGNVGIIIAGIIGALAVLALLLIVSKFIVHAITLLVVGLMFSYFTAAFINVLFLGATETTTRQYVIWGLGSFEGLTGDELFIFFMVIVCMSFLCLFLVRTLNALVLGIEYAASVGIHVKRARILLIIVTGVLAAIVTVYCGPVGFIGIAVPQLIRFLVRSKNYAVILPIAFLGGGLLALCADFIVRQSGNLLPLNTVTALIGAPVIVWVIINMNKKGASI